MDRDFFTPAALHTEELSIKKSRFITCVGPACNRDQAEHFIRQMRLQHPQASHVCWAYIAGAPETTIMSMSDDGEPSGSAGRPMLNVLMHSGLGEVVATVVRYFGGTKLGIGGLQRAYSQAVSDALKNIELHKKNGSAYTHSRSTLCFRITSPIPTQ